jgi:short-chain fatty acids transporter
VRAAQARAGRGVHMTCGNTPRLSAIALRCCAWSERWFPDAFAFAIAALAAVALAALGIGVAPLTIAQSFGDGFWSLIPFTMQMSFIIIGGYVTADSPPIARVVRALARLPRSGRGAVALVAIVSIGLSLLHWGLSLVFGSLLVRALAQRRELRMDYRAAGAAACLGLGSVWALGLSSSAAQLQANPGSMPASLLQITGVIPFRETIFLWQSMLLAAIVALVSWWIAWKSAPDDRQVVTAGDLGIELPALDQSLPARARPGDWLEYSPLPSLFVGALGLAWLVSAFAHHGFAATISNLNSYNLMFLIAGLLLQWRPRRFMESVARSVPRVGGILVQFPFLGAIAAIMTSAASANGRTLASVLGAAFTHLAHGSSFALVIGAYSALLGVFLPSGGGKWIIEAPYVMQAANQAHVHLGWVVQIYNAAEALPNLINPFWMLPVLGMLGLKARDLMGFTLVQFIIHLPLVLLLLWLLGMTLTYHAPVMPP